MLIADLERSWFGSSLFGIGNISNCETEGADKVTKTITYDACGNPKEYLGKNMVWNAVNNSLTSISFKEGNKDKKLIFDCYVQEYENIPSLFTVEIEKFINENL